MKKVFSISLLLLMLTALLHVSVATHYCSGKIASKTISLSGKVASCGMTESKNRPSETVYTKHCCENSLVYFGTDSNYFPSFHFLPDNYPQPDCNFDLSFETAFKCRLSNTTYIENPPGNEFYCSVDLSDICILRI
jgi:hypothetical protein